MSLGRVAAVKRAASYTTNEQEARLGVEVGERHREEAAKRVARNDRAPLWPHHLAHEKLQLRHPRVDAVLQPRLARHGREGPGGALAEEVDGPDAVRFGQFRDVPVKMVRADAEAVHEEQGRAGGALLNVVYARVVPAQYVM